MALRTECKFCGKSVGVSRLGKLYVHGFEREGNVTRLGKICEGSRKDVSEAANEPVNDIRPCNSCGMPVVIAVGQAAPDEVLCPVCLVPKENA